MITKFLNTIKIILSKVTDTLLMIMNTIVQISIHIFTLISQFLAAFDCLVDNYQESTQVYQ